MYLFRYYPAILYDWICDEEQLTITRVDDIAWSWASQEWKMFKMAMKYDACYGGENDIEFYLNKTLVFSNYSYTLIKANNISEALDIYKEIKA